MPVAVIAVGFERYAVCLSTTKLKKVPAVVRVIGIGLPVLSYRLFSPKLMGDFAHFRGLFNL
jgi:hypothetical protein